MKYNQDKIKLYQIDINYIKYLHNIDREVYYDEENENYEMKPYVGILVTLNGLKYCIPLTSAKSKHLNFKNITPKNILIYENMLEEELNERKNDKWVYSIIEIQGKRIGKHILSSLNIGKMIPVVENCCHEIDISKNDNKCLLLKEYLFLLNKKDVILKKATKLYEKQKYTGVVMDECCNYSALEQACLNYKTKQ